MVGRTFARVALAAAFVVGFAAQAKACYPEGDWYHTTASGEVQKLTLTDNGSLEFAGTKGTWKAAGGRMAGTLALTTGSGDGEVATSYKFELAYNGSYDNETLTLSGGSLEKPLVFFRTAHAAPSHERLTRSQQPSPEQVTPAAPATLDGATEAKSTDGRFKLSLPAKWTASFDGSTLLASTGTKARVRFEFLPVDRADAAAGFEKVAKTIETSLARKLDAGDATARATLDTGKELVRTLEWSSKRGDETVTVQVTLVQRATHVVVAIAENGDAGVQGGVLAALASSAVESSPRERDTEKALVGSWRAGTESYAFAADGTYGWKAPGVDERGRFEIRGGFVYLRSTRGEQAIPIDRAADLKLGGISFTK